MNAILMSTVATGCILTALLLLHMVWQWACGYPSTLKTRLRQFTSKQPFHGSQSIFKRQSEPWSSEVDRRPSIGQMAERLLEQSGTEWSVRSFAIRSGVSGALVSLVAAFFLNAYAMVFVPLGCLLPICYLVCKRRRRRNQLAKQLPAVLQFLGRAVRSGQTVPSAMSTVAEAFSVPVSTEFALCCDQQRLGLSRESSLREMAVRCGVMELQIFVVALIVQSRSGGDIVTMLENLAVTLRKRQQFDQRVRCLTAEGRMQAFVLMALPIVAFAGLYFLAPDYIGTLIERPSILVAALSAQALGACWVQSIIRIDV
ncbi:Bacterial type II secretion system protein F domain protein [Novipirellula galeiformis]|uniref:Bacterial type II secretion system protein F domain protein n=1 Tax=Novipirellula galeiformis TaxID=2528004 RepID=A0A5C6C0E7_9BACT|nr:type II secretion system F family protein [Novipirellula galeiformis]TWU17447.1 Bacterial type II secretion system protein F domain protein [Novipirellula galeiformis]